MQIKNNNKKITLLIMLCLLVGQVSAQYQIKKYSINNGGSQLSGGNYEMNSSIAQVNVSTVQQNNNYELTSGFWQQNTDLIYKDGFK